MTGGLGVGWRERDRKGMGEGRGVALSGATDWRARPPPARPFEGLRVSGPSTRGCPGITFKKRLIWRGIENQ